MDLKNKISDPFRLLPFYAKQVGGVCKFEFARYYYKKRTVEDKREVLIVSSDEIENFIFSEVLFKSQAENYDLALQSKIYSNDNKFIGHIPMVDLFGKPTSEEMNSIIEVFNDFEIKTVLLYLSGTSFHVYGIGKLIAADQFVNFCARLLLLNGLRRQVIDTRWVGHRLLAGYFALRISRTQAKYKRFPLLHTAFNLDFLQQIDNP